MNILELEKIHSVSLDSTLNKIVFALQYKNYPVLLAGSSGLRYNRFVTDYDLVTNLGRKPPEKELFEKINSFLKKLGKMPNVWVTEFKLQTEKNEKLKFFPHDIFTEDDLKKLYKDLAFVKIDLVFESDNLFYEVSMIYNFIPPVLENIRKSIEEDIVHYTKEKKYYKVLKRKFLLYKMDENQPKIQELMNIFSSDVGEQYALLNRYQAIELLRKNYKDDNTTKHLLLGLRAVGLPPTIEQLDNMEPLIDDLLAKINREAKVIGKQNLN